MALPLLGTNAQIIRLTEALYGVQPGNTYYTSFQEMTAESGITGLAAALVSFAPGNDSAENLAASVASNFFIEDADVEGLIADFIAAQLNNAGQENWGATILEIVDLYSTLVNDETLGASASMFNQHIIWSKEYSQDPANTEVAESMAPVEPVEPGITVDLTTAQDNLVGSDAAEAFTAIVFNNSNTLQSGDAIDGGEGADSLYAEIGSSQAFAISAKTTSVEQIFINARSDSRDSNDNNLQNDFVQIDAGEMVGVTEWGTNGSRADVVIEDIRIQDAEITSDITFSMRDTDPGSAADGADGAIVNDTQTGASLHAYFDANSLRSTTQTSQPSFLIEVLDIQGKVDNPLSDGLQQDTNDGFEFTIKDINGNVGAPVQILNDTGNAERGITSISGADTYEQLVAAIEYGFEILPEPINVKVEIAGTYDRNHKTITGLTATGNFIQVTLLDDAYAGSFDSGKWLGAKVDQDASVNISANILAGDDSTVSNLLVASNLILDNVGRGSEGGDAEIGTMSTRGGVEEINIKVEDSSWVTNVRSTNNALEVVTVETSDVARDAVTNTGNISTGYLYLGSGPDFTNNDLTNYRVTPTHVATNGLVDVRVFDSSSFAGDLKLGASLTHASIEKYLQIPSNTNAGGVLASDTDLNGTEQADTVEFLYNLGATGDFLNMSLDSDLTADSDFNFNIRSNGGNDDIRTVIGLANHTTTPGVLPTWQEAQAQLDNLTIDSGDGADTVATVGAGDFTINTQSGDDAIYADNSGVLPGVAATVNDQEEQTVTFGPAVATGVISVGGINVNVTAADTAIVVGGLVAAALVGNPLFASVTDNADGTVTFVWLENGNVDPIEVIDLGAPTSVENDDAFAETQAAIVPQQQVQTITFSGATQTGNVVLDDTIQTGTDGASALFGAFNVPVVNGDPDTVVAQKVVDFMNDPLNADPALESVVLGTDGVSVVFTWAAVGVANDIDETALVSANGSSFLNQNGVAAQSEVQTLDFSGAGANGAGVIIVDGVEVTLLVTDTNLQVATKVAAALNVSLDPKYTSVAVVGETVEFTFSGTDNHELLTYVDQGILTGVTSNVVTDTEGSVVGSAFANQLSSDIFGLTGARAVWTANNLDADNNISTLGESAFASFDGTKGQLQVTFKGVTSDSNASTFTADWTTIQSTNGTTSAFQIRQALKSAINNDSELSKLLVVKDGPNDTFVVESLIDGEMNVADLAIDFRAPLTVGATPVAGWLQLAGTEVGFDANGANGANLAYAEAFGLNDRNQVLTGADSTSISDNKINAGTGSHDVTVMGTTDDGVAEMTSSNDTAVFTDANFGFNTIVNFQLDTDAGFGGDQLDFTAYLSSAVNGGNSVFDNNDAILGQNEIIIGSTAGMTTAADTAAQGISLVQSASTTDVNVFDVHTLSSTAASTEIVLTMVGTVDMSDTLIVGVADFTAPDFV